MQIVINVDDSGRISSGEVPSGMEPTAGGIDGGGASFADEFPTDDDPTITEAFADNGPGLATAYPEDGNPAEFDSLVAETLATEALDEVGDIDAGSAPSEIIDLE